MLISRMLETAPPRPALEPPGRHRRAGRRGLGILVALALLAAVAGAGVLRYYSWCAGASGPTTPLTFRVPEGASGSEVVDALHAKGIIRCGLMSTYLLRRSGLADSLRAGTFHLTTNLTPNAAFRALSSPAPPATVRFTIPEGYRLTQIAERSASELGIPAGQFLALANGGTYSLSPYLPRGRKTTEGFLFPNTYRFVKGETTAGDVIERLLHQFGEEVRNLDWARAKALGVSPYQVVTIASMIEREAKVPGDRAKIAAVIYNRLRAHMPLGIDATLEYVDPTPGDGLSESELAMSGPYNTRLHVGLPPTPIASPGLPSIEAALDPAHVDYLYYVLCGQDGHHAFAASFGRFQRLKGRCLG